MTFILEKFTRDQIVGLVRQFGGTTTDAVLDPNSKIFIHPQIEGFISYRLEKEVCVTFGDPICKKENLLDLTKAFLIFAEEKKCQAIFITTSEGFRELVKDLMVGSIQCCHNLALNPILEDPRKKSGTHASLVRRKTKQAIKEGVTFHELADENIEEHSIAALGKDWVLRRKGPQIHISHVHLFDDRLGKRWFYAKKENQLVGIFVLNKLENKNGWLLNHLMLAKDAPNGTPEALIIFAIETLAKENCPYLTFGIVPQEYLDAITGFHFSVTWIIQKLYRLAWKLLKLNGFSMFWNKFLPQTEPLYILFYPPKLGVSTLFGLAQAFNLKIFK